MWRHVEKIAEAHAYGPLHSNQSLGIFIPFFRDSRPPPPPSSYKTAQEEDMHLGIPPHYSEKANGERERERLYNSVYLSLSLSVGKTFTFSCSCFPTSFYRLLRTESTTATLWVGYSIISKRKDIKPTHNPISYNS
jgi:hypothetical protein